MVPHKPSPREALSRWLAQIHYNAVRNIETTMAHVKTMDRQRPLRGFRIANDLVMTRKRTFYQIKGTNAAPVSIEMVAANYNLDELRAKYREATDEWKNGQRALRRRRGA